MSELMSYNQVLWASRRGMLELDLVLVPFVEKVYPTLSETEQREFQDLLASEDQELFVWFMQRSLPEDEVLARMVTRIVSYAQTPPHQR